MSSQKGMWEQADDQEELIDPKGMPWPEGTVSCLTELADQCLELARHDRPPIQKVTELGLHNIFNVIYEFNT